MDPAAQAAELISRLNDPRHISSATIISKQLLELQLSPAGWSIADALLKSSDATFQFYGALSFQVKLNRTAGSSETITQDEADAVLERLVVAFCSCVQNHGPTRVLDKICSALATYLVQSPTPLEHALEKIALALVNGQTFTAKVGELDSEDGDDAIKGADLHQSHALIRLCRFFAEDLGRHEGTSLKNHKIEEALKTSFAGFAGVLYYIIDKDHDPTPQFKTAFADALSAYVSWSHYTINHWQHDIDIWEGMQRCTDKVMQHIKAQDMELAMGAASAVAEALSYGSKFVDKDQLTEAWPLIEEAESRFSHASLEERLPLLKLTAAFAKNVIPDITKHPETPVYRTALGKLTQALFAVDWAEDGCDQLTVILEFWMDMADYLVDYCSEMFLAYKEKIIPILQPIIEALFDALDRREDDIMQQVDDDYLEDWRRCCIDFAEIMTKLMETDFVPVYSICAAQLEQALEEQKWFRVEAVLQLLNEMANDYDGMPASEQGLAQIFNSDKFEVLIQPSTLDHLSPRLIRLLVRFIDNYSSFFKSQPARIPPVVTLLMAMLNQNISKESKLADLAAKCMASICSSCRNVLVSMADDLLSFCETALSSKDLTAYQRDKLYGSMAFVIQALTDERDKILPVQSLVEKLHNDVEEGKSLVQQGQTELGEQKIATAFQCLAAVGKALHSGQREVRVDSDDEATPGNGNTVSNPWDTPEGKSVPLAIIECLKAVELAPTNGDVWEGVCSVLRIGLSETESGPFVFPSALISRFLSSMTPETPRLEALVTTACTFVSAHSRSSEALIPEEILPVFSAVSSILLSLESPTTDPALAQLCTDFLERLILRYQSILAASPSLEPILLFQLESLTSDAPMLKRASASFLAEFLLKLDDEDARAFFLPMVARALVHQISGHAQRSELDALSRLWRVVMNTVPVPPGASRLLTDALHGPAWDVGNDDRVSDGDKRAFVQRMVMLRGGRGTADAVKEFWAKCRGTVGRF